MSDLTQLKDVIGKVTKYEFISIHYMEAIVVAIATILFLIFTKPKPDPIRREEHEGKSVQIISDETTCDQVMNEILEKNKSSLMFGFDCEWTPSIAKFNNKQYKIGLLQLATATDIILIRLNKMHYILPESLKQFLTNPSIIKCGVGIHQDITKLYRDFEIKTLGVIELNDIYKLSTYFERKPAEITQKLTKTKSLKNLYEITCEQTMKYKSKEVAISHWNSYDDYLSLEQIHYAADDASVGYDILMALMMDIYGIIDTTEFIQECQPFIDKAPIKPKKKEKTANDIVAAKQQKIKDQQKAERRKQRQGQQNSAPKYKILRPDGNVLFYVGGFQFEWFIANKLAVKNTDDENERSCTLIFSGVDTVDTNDDEKANAMDNICFVCGMQDNEGNEVEMHRFNIFPNHYWKFMENEEIQQRALIGNMIPLCDKTKSNCYCKAKQFRMDYVEWFCQRYPDIVKHPHLVKEEEGWSHARSAANALNKAHETIPIQRKIELVKIVADWFKLRYNEDDIKQDESIHYEELLKIQGDGEKSSNEIFRQCMNELLKDEKEELKLHCMDLMKQYKGNEKEFVQIWRRKFVEVMQPQFVPSYWPLTEI